MKADDKITTREIINLVRLFTYRFGEDAYIYIQEKELSKMLENPGDVKLICQYLVDNYTQEELLKIFIDLLSLVYVDDIDVAEIEMIIDIAGYFGLNEEVVNFYFELFSGILEYLQDKPSLISYGDLHTKADLPIVNLNGKGVVFQLQDQIYILNFMGNCAMLNGKQVHNYCAIPFGESDRLSLGNHIFEYQDIIDIFLKKVSEDEEILWINQKKNEIELNHNNNVASIAKIHHKKNIIEIFLLSKHYTLLIGNKSVENDYPITIFDREKISFSELKGDLSILKEVKITAQKELPVSPIQNLETGIFSLSGENLYFKFPKSNDYILQDISFEIHSGELCAIIGPSGAGKSTLLNTLLGLYEINSGYIKINGKVLDKGLSQIQDHIGYVPQDDLLIDVLTVWENLYYKYKLIKDPEGNHDKALVNKELLLILDKVGLSEKNRSKVGSAEDRKLSGGERKKLNIALELVTDPDIIILDEPTSGLASHDAQEIAALLRKMANQGKIVLIVIHQPSSDIYKMFDKVIILNKGGELAYFGNKIQALTLFRDITDDAYDVECLSCKRVNPDLLMNVLTSESQNFWRALSHINKVFSANDTFKQREEDENKIYEETLSLPPVKKYTLGYRLKQSLHLFHRILLHKLRDKMNIYVTLIIAPSLSLLTSFLLRYNAFPDTPYSFAENSMYPTFLFLMVIVAIFFGISNSASDIIRDRLILKRERVLNIPLSGYFFSKFIVLMLFAIIQNILFIIPAHLILEEYYMILYHLLFMTLISSTGIAFGLLGSTFFKTVTAAYNLIPLILIPQIILGGALVEYEQLNREFFIDKQSPIPELADLMISRWAFELLVTSNVDLHPINQLREQEQEQKKNLLNLLQQGEITPEERARLSEAITKEYGERSQEIAKYYNSEIKLSSALLPGEYLSVENNWCNGYFRTWKRNLIVLIGYALILLVLGFIRLKTIKF